MSIHSPGLWTPPSSNRDRKVLGEPRMHKVTSAPGRPEGREYRHVHQESSSWLPFCPFPVTSPFPPSQRTEGAEHEGGGICHPALRLFYLHLIQKALEDESNLSLDFVCDLRRVTLSLSLSFPVCVIGTSLCSSCRSFGPHKIIHDPPDL